GGCDAFLTGGGRQTAEGGDGHETFELLETAHGLLVAMLQRPVNSTGARRSAGQDQRHELGAYGGEFFGSGAALMADLDTGPAQALDLVGQHGLAIGGAKGYFERVAPWLGRDGTAHHEAGLLVVDCRADDQCGFVIGAAVPGRQFEMHMHDVARFGRVTLAHGVEARKGATLTRNRLRGGCWRV